MFNSKTINQLFIICLHPNCFLCFLHMLLFPDIIKLFNPKLIGAAAGKTVHGMQAHISETGFNLAVTGHNTL